MVNKVFLLGNLGSEVNVRHMPDGRAVANVSIATTEVWRDNDGTKNKHTEWHRLNFFARQAEIAADFLHKGSSVFVEGQLRTRKWKDAEGNERQTTEIRVHNFKMIGPRQDRDSGSGDQENRSRPADSSSTAPRKQTTAKGGGDDDSFSEMEEDIPW